METNRLFPTTSTYLKHEMRKNYKHFKSLEKHNKVLNRFFFDDTGGNFKRQYVRPKTTEKGTAFPSTQQSILLNIKALLKRPTNSEKCPIFSTFWKISRILTQNARQVYKLNKGGWPH